MEAVGLPARRPPGSTAARHRRLPRGGGRPSRTRIRSATGSLSSEAAEEPGSNARRPSRSPSPGPVPRRPTAAITRRPPPPLSARPSDRAGPPGRRLATAIAGLVSLNRLDEGGGSLRRLSSRRPPGRGPVDRAGPVAPGFARPSPTGTRPEGGPDVVWIGETEPSPAPKEGRGRRRTRPRPEVVGDRGGSSSRTTAQRADPQPGGPPDRRRAHDGRRAQLVLGDRLWRCPRGECLLATAYTLMFARVRPRAGALGPGGPGGSLRLTTLPRSSSP